MAFGISKDVIEEVRSRCDIVDLIGSFVPLKRAGTNTYRIPRRLNAGHVGMEHQMFR